MSDMNKFEILKQSLNLASNPIGVKLIYDHDKVTVNDLMKLITERKKILNKQGPHSKLI